jgi:adenine-specific DNA methylase
MSLPTQYVTRYMGNKGTIIDFVGSQIRSILPKDGTLVDPMCGLGAIPYAFKSSASLICNDTSPFASFATKVLLQSPISKISAATVDHALRGSLDPFADHWFARTFGDTYFSVQQCCEIAKIRERLSALSESEMRLGLLALISAMGVCQSSTGHYAQFLNSEHPRVQKLREQSVSDVFRRRAGDFDLTPPARSSEVKNIQAVDFLSEITDRLDGSVVYLDPPYSTAQYSRFYHLLDTLVLWDKPSATGKGRYRPERFQSPFCSPRRAKQALSEILAITAASGASVVMSYGSHGILKVEEIVEEISFSFNKLKTVEMNHNHSTQGKGWAQRTELIFVARNH